MLGIKWEWRTFDCFFLAKNCNRANNVLASPPQLSIILIIFEIAFNTSWLRKWIMHRQTSFYQTTTTTTITTITSILLLLYCYIFVGQLIFRYLAPGSPQQWNASCWARSRPGFTATLNWSFPDHKTHFWPRVLRFLLAFSLQISCFLPLLLRRTDWRRDTVRPANAVTIHYSLLTIVEEVCQKSCVLMIIWSCPIQQNYTLKAYLYLAKLNKIFTCILANFYPLIPFHLFFSSPLFFVFYSFPYSSAARPSLS